MKKKMMGAVALSAALALGTAVPAFALDASVTPGADANGKGDLTVGADKKNTGSTDVKVLAEVTQINATLPMDVTVVANVQGGQLLVSPTGTTAGDALGYRVENRTELPLELVNVKAAPGTDNRWVYVDAPINTAADIANAGAADKLGRLNLTLLQNSDVIGDATTKGTVVTAGGSALGWTVPAATKGGDGTAVNGKLGIKIGGTSSFINTKDEIATADKSAVKLTYTIGVKTTAATTTPDPSAPEQTTGTEGA